MADSQKTAAPRAVKKKVLRPRTKKSPPATDDPLPADDDLPPAIDDVTSMDGGTAASIDDVPPVVAKKATEKGATVKEEQAVWCDASVAKMFELRYKTDLKGKFESKNNFQKNLAAVTLAGMLSVAMNRTFTANQITTKVPYVWFI